MENVKDVIKTTLLFRAGSNTEIEECYKNKRLTFSCPANWISYDYAHDNGTIGDKLECVFAHVKNDNPILEEIKERKKWNAVHKIPTTLGTYFLRSVPSILAPTLCFFHLNLSEIAKVLKVDIEQGHLDIDLDKYLEAIDYNVGDASYLIITNAKAFEEDLRNSIPHTLKKSKVLTDKLAPAPITKENCIAKQLVDYTIPNEYELFDFTNEFQNSTFKKRKKYSIQSELRIVVNGVIFKQEYCYQDSYDYKINTLQVELPNLHDYAIMFTSRDIRRLSFSNYNPKTGSFKFKALTDNPILRIDKEEQHG